MSHDIAQIMGRAAIAIAQGKPAWHGHGTPMSGTESAPEAMAKAMMQHWGPVECRLAANDVPLDVKAILRDQLLQLVRA
jgi:hypothetical protein